MMQDAIEFFGLLTLFTVGLKAMGYVDWPWLMSFMPLLGIPYAAYCND